MNSDSGPRSASEEWFLCFGNVPTNKHVYYMGVSHITPVLTTKHVCYMGVSNTVSWWGQIGKQQRGSHSSSTF